MPGWPGTRRGSRLSSQTEPQPAARTSRSALFAGLALAVLIDATIIRGVMLPAAMKLLGEWNWYMPRWLEWVPSLTPEEGKERQPRHRAAPGH